MKASIFPAITLYQPWATWIMLKWKTIETRTHDRFVSLRGNRILIHAGGHIDKSAYLFHPYLTEEQLAATKEVPIGAILGSAFVSEFKLLSDEDSRASLIDCRSVQRWGLVLTDIEPFETPIPVKGGMGIWYFDLSTNTKVLKKDINQAV